MIISGVYSQSTSRVTSILKFERSFEIHTSVFNTARRGGFACFPSFFALLEDEWLPVKALNMCILVEVPHGFFHFTNEIYSFYYVAKFLIV